MGETATSEGTDSASVESLLTAIDRAQGLATAFKQGLPPHLEREAEHLEEDLDVLEEWADAFDDGGADALTGGPVVVKTARERVAYFDEQIGDGDPDLQQRLDNLADALEDVEKELDAFEISAVSYVTYVNRSFAARYFDPDVLVGTILADAGRVDVDELGLYPLDGLFGKAIPDLAFPASKEVDLRQKHRTYWESESDGGSIA